ncbi:MAG TPA: hypothetical protein VMU24_10080 [Candidatus Acidoferrales bacterium]|nr:hypothetical protein [Candidatus Acidoferrales bacterium]
MTTHKDDRIDAVAEALESLTERLDLILGADRSRGTVTRDQSAPRSVLQMKRDRNVSPVELQGTLFAVRVPVGRRGEFMPGYLLFPPVANERALEELAQDVQREFKFATVYQPRAEHRNGYDRNYSRERRWR